MPSLGSAMQNWTSSATILMSAPSASWNPPPIAWPWTTAMRDEAVRDASRRHAATRRSARPPAPAAPPASASDPGRPSMPSGVNIAPVQARRRRRVPAPRRTTTRTVSGSVSRDAAQRVPGVRGLGVQALGPVEGDGRDLAPPIGRRSSPACGRATSAAASAGCQSPVSAPGTARALGLGCGWPRRDRAARRRTRTVPGARSRRNGRASRPAPGCWALVVGLLQVGGELGAVGPGDPGALLELWSWCVSPRCRRAPG